MGAWVNPAIHASPDIFEACASLTSTSLLRAINPVVLLTMSLQALVD